MEMNNEFIVFRNKEVEAYLESFNNHDGRLSFKATFVEDIENALVLDEKSYTEQKEQFLPLCEALSCKPIRVKAEYTLETLDGEPAKEIEEKEDDIPKKFKDFKKMMDKLFK